MHDDICTQYQWLTNRGWSQGGIDHYGSMGYVGRDRGNVQDVAEWIGGCFDPHNGGFVIIMADGIQIRQVGQVDGFGFDTESAKDVEKNRLWWKT